MKIVATHEASWVRVDLHLHSPNSDTFTLSSGMNIKSDEQRKLLVKNYVSRLKETGIKIAAITDYNGVSEAWYGGIKEEAAREEITVLPGAELDFPEGKYGLHVLLVFDENESIDGINRLISSFDRRPADELFGERKHRRIEPTSNSLKNLQEVRSSYGNRCLIIFPHPEDDNGLCKSLKTDQIPEYLEVADGIEWITPAQRNSILSTGKLKSDFFERFAIIENSDPKTIEGIGAKKRKDQLRATFVKLGAANVEALRYAFHDPQTRVRLHETPEMFFDRLVALRIQGSGFLKDVEIHFHPELNTLIGGRGVGKSAILEALRYVMDLPVYADKSFRTDFVQQVVGSGGEISLEVERFYGKQRKGFLIQRTIGKETEVLDETGGRTDFSVQTIFDRNGIPILIGQKELYFLSIDSGFLLRLIDEIIGEDVQNREESFRKDIELLEENARKLLELENRISQKDAYEQHYKENEAKIKVFRELKVEKKLIRWTSLIEDDQHLEELMNVIGQVREEISSTFDDWESRIADIVDSLGRGKSEYKAILEDLAGLARTIHDSLSGAKAELLHTFDTKAIAIEDLYKSWNEKKNELEKDIQKVKKDLGEKDLDPERLGRLTRERAQLQSLLKELEKVEKEFTRLKNEREELKKSTETDRHELFKIRRERLDKVNKALKERLRIDIKYEGDTTSFGEQMRNLLKGASIHADTISALVNPKGKTSDGLMVSRILGQGEEKTQKEFDLTPAMSRRFCEWFNSKERLFKLETLFPEDKIDISLNVNGQFKPIDKLSAGQKATALLLLLLAQVNRILILDQPEEDLDNRFIYEDVVKILREMKGKRQLIVTSHNANIPVLGDSEQVIALETKDERCSIKASGSVETMKQDVKDIMEGGEEAFLLRAQKYGGI